MVHDGLMQVVRRVVGSAEVPSAMADHLPRAAHALPLYSNQRSPQANDFLGYLKSDELRPRKASEYNSERCLFTQAYGYKTRLYTHD